MNSVKCYLCDKFYETKCKLNVHIRNTHSEKVSCKVCSKEFSNSSNAEKHARTVHDGLLALCPCCLKECRKDHMKRHLKTCQGKYSCKFIFKFFKFTHIKLCT